MYKSKYILLRTSLELSACPLCTASRTGSWAVACLGAYPYVRAYIRDVNIVDPCLVLPITLCCAEFLSLRDSADPSLLLLRRVECQRAGLGQTCPLIFVASQKDNPFAPQRLSESVVDDDVPEDAENRGSKGPAQIA